MPPSAIQRFRDFANAYTPAQPVDRQVGLIGADLHKIADALEENNFIPSDMIMVHELDLRGGANNLRPILPLD